MSFQLIPAMVSLATVSSICLTFAASAQNIHCVEPLPIIGAEINQFGVIFTTALGYDITRFVVESPEYPADILNLRDLRDEGFMPLGQYDYMHAILRDIFNNSEEYREILMRDDFDFSIFATLGGQYVTFGNFQGVEWENAIADFRRAHDDNLTDSISILVTDAFTALHRLNQVQSICSIHMTPLSPNGQGHLVP